MITLPVLCIGSFLLRVRASGITYSVLDGLSALIPEILLGEEGTVFTAADENPPVGFVPFHQYSVRVALGSISYFGQLCPSPGQFPPFQGLSFLLKAV